MRRDALSISTGWPRQIYPSRAGWNTIRKIYQNVRIAEALLSERHANAIAALSITNQRETVVVWDQTNSKPVYNAIVWQCMRGEKICTDLSNAGHEQEILKRTGLVVDPYFSASKIKWILDHAAAEVDREKLLFGTIDSWLIWKLTDGRVHACDYSNASRTMLFNIQRLEWDQDIFDLLDIPLAMAPEVRSSNAEFGSTDLGGLLPRPVPICGVMGDSQAALFGQGCITPGSAKVTYGTGSSIVLNIVQSLAAGWECTSGVGSMVKLIMCLKVRSLHRKRSLMINTLLRSRMQKVRDSRPISTRCGGVYLSRPLWA